MKEGNIILTPLPQSDGQIKLRPVLVLRIMPKFNDLLVCGISTNLRQKVSGFDEEICTDDEDFKQCGLLKDSLIRLGFLAVLPVKQVAGSIGKISKKRHTRLLEKLANYIKKSPALSTTIHQSPAR